MRIIAFTIIAFFYLTSSGQELMKIRDVFDFSIGDILQYTDHAYQTKNRETIKILSRSYSNNNDTIYYSASKKFYYKESDGSIRLSTDTIKLIYTNLDSSIFDYLPEYKYDSLIKNGWNLDYYDTIVEYNANLCGNLANGFRFAEFESGRSYLFGKGLGLVEEVIPVSDWPDSFWTYKVLSYFNKSGFECGEFDLTKIESINLPEYTVYIHPNPVKEILNLEIISNKQNVSVLKIIDFTGDLVLCKKIKNVSAIDLTGLPSGAYILSILIDKSIINKIIIKQ